MVTTFLSMGISGDAESLLRAYTSQGTVNANVSLLASSTAKPEWKLFVKDKVDNRARYSTASEGSDQRVERTQHAALSVLNNPARYLSNGRLLTAWTRFSLFELSGIYLELLGKSAWVVDFGQATFPLGLWPVRPDRLSTVTDPDNYITGYWYTAPDSSEKVPLRPHEVIWNKYPNPIDPYDGIGPTQSVMTEIEGIRYAGEWNRNFFLNSARPDGVLSIDHHADDDEWEEITERWREAHRGVGRSHRIAVLENVTWVPTSTSVKDMDFVNLRTDARDAIRESYGMHKVMTGVTDDVNRANAQTGEEVFANWKVVPRLDRWRDVLNYQFLPLFYPSGADIPYEFDYIYPLPANREQDNAELKEKSTAVQRLIQSGYEPHAVLEVVGLPDMDVAVVATQAPALPASWVAEPQPADDSPGADQATQGDGGTQATHALAARLQNKVPPESVNFREATGLRRCEECIHFQPSRQNRMQGTCELVDIREVDRNDVCNLWDPVDNRSPDPQQTVSAKKDPKAKVLAQLAGDYPPGAMAWAHHCAWTGPVTMPTEYFNPDMQWMDRVDPNHVSDFVKLIRAGKKLKPVIAVKTPGAGKPRLVDGHHRYKADLDEGLPLRAWIATVDSEHGPWEQMHDQQKDHAPRDMKARLEKVLANGHMDVEFAALKELT